MHEAEPFIATDRITFNEFHLRVFGGKTGLDVDVHHPGEFRRIRRHDPMITPEGVLIGYSSVPDDVTIQLLIDDKLIAINHPHRAPEVTAYIGKNLETGHFIVELHEGYTEFLTPLTF